MKELLSLARGILTFDHATYVAHVRSPHALKRGLLLIAVVALLSGVFTLLGGLVSSAQPLDPAALEREIRAQIEQQAQFNPAMGDPEFQKYFEGSLREGIQIAVDINRLPANIPFLPRVIGDLLQPLGMWLSRPLAWIGAWAWYALWVMLFAKLLGGRATLERLLGATGVYILPHILYILGDLLSLLSNVPPLGCCVGLVNFVLGLGAWAWGVAIYVKAMAVANELSLEKAAVAAVLPALLAIVLIGLLGLLGLLGIIVGASS